MLQSMLLTVVTAICVVELAERQIVFAPLALLRQTTSSRPSPSKSPVPTIFHTRLFTVVIGMSVALLAARQI